MQLIKYPRTHHIQGSRFQPGDEDLDSVPFSQIKGRHLVVEEKMDGANSALSFDKDGNLLLQSRGHFLTGGEREKHFNLFKQWSNSHVNELRELLGSRFIAYGEWLYAKHTVFYDELPHYWLEFDVYDRETNSFLSTEQRTEIFEGSCVRSVKVLSAGVLQDHKSLLSLMGKSCFISEIHMDILRKYCESQSLSAEITLRETDPSRNMEGLYIKVEENGSVVERYKLVRKSFLTSVVESESHWLDRPIIPNKLSAGTSIF